MGAARSLEKLTNVLGAHKAGELIEQTKRAVGVEELDDPNDLLRFAQELMKQGGIIEAVGRAIKIQALLAGADAGAAQRPAPARRRFG